MKKTNVICVASFGGHLVQLRRVANLLEGYNIHLICTEHLSISGFYSCHKVRDCNLRTPYQFICCFFQALKLILSIKPKVIVTTGALPGLAFVIWGRLFKTKTIWIDSIANSSKLSFSGRLARIIATKCLTQWKDLSDGEKIFYKGRVI